MVTKDCNTKYWQNGILYLESCELIFYSLTRVKMLCLKKWHIYKLKLMVQWRIDQSYSLAIFLVDWPADDKSPDLTGPCPDFEQLWIAQISSCNGW